MNSSKLYSILEYFNKYEQNRLRKYLLSPYFNKNQTLVHLFEILIKNINSQTPKELSKEGVWKKLNKSEKYDDVRFRKHFSDLLKLVEGFLAQQVYEENPLHQATYLMEAIEINKMEKLYNSSMKSARRLSNQQFQKPANYYYHQYQIERIYYELAQHELKRAKKTNVEEIANNLDRFYIAEKLRLYCLVLNQKLVASHEYELLFMDEIISHVNKNNYNFDSIPAISIYYQVFLTITETANQNHYFKLKSLLENHSLEIPKHEVLPIYHSAINYCIQNANKGQQQFLQELFDLYFDLIKKEIIFTDGELSPWDFKNIVSCALRLGNYDWTEEFIKTYSSYLPEDFRENAVSFNLAQLYYYQKEFNKVIRLLQTVEYEDFTYNLNSKTMLLLIYYETDEIEALYSLLESFRAYLNRHKNLPDHRRIHYLNLIKFTKKLTKIMPGESKALLKLKEEIKTTKEIANLKWLKEKIAELE